MRTFKTYLVIGVLVLALIVLVVWLAPAARANTQHAQNGKDAAWVTHGYTVNSGGVQEHRVLHISDNECDGHTAYVQYQVEGLDSRKLLKDNTACHNGHSWISWVKTGRAITWMRVGEHYAGAHHWSKWKRVYSHAWA